MPLTRANPIGVEAVGEIEIDLDDEIQRLGLQIEAAEGGRSHWVNDQLKLLEQREGIRKAKAVPWPGANNDNWPVTDAVIRRWKPSITGLVLDSTPVCFFFGRNEQSAVVQKSAENFYDWLFLNHMDDVELSIYELADAIAQFGMAYTRQGWDYQTERNSRVAAIDTLFPGGVEQTTQMVQQQVQQMNEQAAEQGQEEQPIPQPEEIVKQIIITAYGLNPENEMEAAQIQEAVEGVLQGKEFVRVVYSKVVKDKPRWDIISPLDVVVPGNSKNVETAEWVAIMHRLSGDEIMRRARDGYFDIEAAIEIAEKMGNRKPGRDDSSHDLSSMSSGQLSRALDTHEGVDSEADDSSPRTKIMEVYCRMDINGDGISERCVLWLHKNTNTVLALYEYPFPFDEWPIVRFEFERKDNRPYSSRGIAKMLSTFQKMTNRVHNGRLDAQQILLSPMWQVRSSGYDLVRNVKFRPGAYIPVQEMGDIQPVVQDMRPLVEFFREEQLTKTLAEQYIGVFDASLTQMGSAGRERRTATEIQAVTSQISTVYEGDARLFQFSMARVHRQIWDLWEDFGPLDIFARVTGESGQMEGRSVNKTDIAGDYELVPAGKPTSTNRAIILGRAREMMQLLMPDETGVVKKDELIRHYLAVMDKNVAGVIVRDEAEMQELQQLKQGMGQLQQQMQETQMNMQGAPQGG